MRFYRLTPLLAFVWALIAVLAVRGDDRDKAADAKAAAPAVSMAQALPTPFAEGVIETEADEYGPTFAPDGATLYMTRRNNRQGDEFILVSHKVADAWTTPEVPSFSGRYYDKEPFVSPDGTKLFFASTRPNPAGDPSADFNIWVVERTESGWSETSLLASAVSSLEYDNYPSTAANGNLYFGSDREGGLGRIDLYRSRWLDGEYQPAENLGRQINTEATEADPYIAPDESYLIFSSTREGSLGEGDLYISFNRAGSWTQPRNLGPIINSSDYEYAPLVAPDGRHFFFSRGWGAIYSIEISALGIEP